MTAIADCTSALQLRVNYPSAILSVASESDCTAGTDWPATSLTFVCNARGNATSVLMNSILQPAFTSQQGGNISVASITFTAIAAGTGTLSVDILGMAQQEGGSVSGVSAVAAAGTVSLLCKPTQWLNSGGLGCEHGHPTSLSTATHAMSKLLECNCCRQICSTGATRRLKVVVSGIRNCE